MIDRAEFAKVMGAFADRIGRALAPLTAELYYDTLSESLTTEEFLVGARIVFRAHTYNTWPAPQLFIDAVKPAQPMLGSEAFEEVLEIMGHSNVPIHERRQQVEALGTVVARAFRAAGGLREFAMVTHDEVPWLRKRFVEACEYATADEARRDRAIEALERGALSRETADIVAGLADSMTFGKPKRITSYALPIPTRHPGE